MIIEMIFTPLFWIMTNLILVLPVFRIPDAYATSMANFFLLSAKIGFFVPIDTIGYIFALWMSFYVLRFALATLSYGLRKIPFLNIN